MDWRLKSNSSVKQVTEFLRDGLKIVRVNCSQQLSLDFGDFGIDFQSYQRVKEVRSDFDFGIVPKGIAVELGKLWTRFSNCLTRLSEIVLVFIIPDAFQNIVLTYSTM